jgi:cell division protease FtsH
MQTELTSRIACLLGGIAAEEIVYHETSTGAQNDLQRATDLARSMVTEFGMSGKLGRVFYGEQHRGMTPFGPAGFPVEQAHSEDTLREIDLEIKRIIDECYQTAADVLTTRREVLEHMTRELVEVEVMDHKHLKKILDEHTTGPQIKPGTHATATADAPEVEGKEDSLPHRESKEGS